MKDSTGCDHRISGAVQPDGMDDHKGVVRLELALPFDLGPRQDDLATVGRRALNLEVS
ncbi:hypothetical protein [Streptomyces sp. NBC_01237]|uniref:hypothetical protein n=1 Tax=Streptomyces sp. NBC_01237 TaxID=2903790 RepID=UPI002DDB8BEB|nr:hypothetical protein [Streptomyces sp. NBC_01237]WRZ73500.1 hypothetical protein OG251_18710 [Streptomyces sp. NBC_01237]